MSRQRDLTDEERILWNLVARSTTPLKGRRFASESETVDPESGSEPARPARPLGAPTPAAAQPSVTPRQQVQHLDRTTQKKLAKGRLPIEARIDLHGMRQDEAHGLLLSFLSRAHAGGLRYVLVITGKGSSAASGGVLRRSVPSWLATPSFRGYVSGYEDASRGHGGEGALYVRLRRKEGGR